MEIRPFYDGRGTGRRGRRPLRKVYRSPSSGPMYLRHGFRRPNFVPKFGASVMGIGPYGEKGRFQQPLGPTAQSGAFGVRSQGMGGDRRKGHPKRGTAAATAGAAL